MRRLGCLGTLVFCLLVLAGVTAVIAPWSFHIGGKWTPLSWWGNGVLRDSSGAAYGLHVYFNPYFSRGHGLTSSGGPHTDLSGDASVCTASGDTFKFRVSGEIRRAWLDAEGKDLHLDFLE